MLLRHFESQKHSSEAATANRRLRFLKTLLHRLLMQQEDLYPLPLAFSFASVPSVLCRRFGCGRDLSLA